MSTLQRLTDRGLVRPPGWLPGNVQYETIMGSVAYGVSSDTSDMDVYGWAIPPNRALPVSSYRCTARCAPWTGLGAVPATAASG